MDQSVTADSAAQPPLPRDVTVNPIRSAADWQRQRAACEADPGAFHGAIAAETIHWFDGSNWLMRDADGVWRGWNATTGEPVERADFTPWTQAFDGSDAPFYRWFVGARTNAAFNEVDRHVLSGHGAEVAYWYEGDRWDAAANGGRGAPVHHVTLTRRELLVRSALAALALRDLGLEQGDRIALNMPNILDQIVWTEGAKRLGVIYTAVFGGFSDKTLSDRIENAGARVVITADGASRNAEVAAFKEAYTDPALDRFVALPAALRITEDVLQAKLGDVALMDPVRKGLEGEITVAPADVMRELGKALDRAGHLDAATIADLRASVAEALTAAPPRVEKVIVVRHVGLPDIAWTPGRDVWAHELLAKAEETLCRAAGLPDMAALRALEDRALYAAISKAVPSVPVDAEYPLFIIYTSGSTGKPKGVVHVHGGYVAGIAHTMKVSFDALPGRDVIYVVADPGWITGQSYLITGTLAARIPGIVTEGAPVFPNAGRFASIIERHKVTIFKAGVTFLKTVMTHPENRADVERYDRSSLRVATFCAEPTSPAVQAFGMAVMTPQYINSYWATEHGGIVWTHPYGNPDQPLRADAHTYPLPWVLGDVWVPEGEPDAGGRVPYRPAEPEEKGEIVVTAPYPYLTRTIWGDADNVGQPGWTGDLDRFAKTYFGRFRDGQGNPVWAYLQGDFARKYADGSFSLHGRSDDVINVSGHRMGTEEIEGAILRDKQINPDSPVGNVIVVGAPHREKGLTPVAFVLPAKGRDLTADDERRMKDLVRQEKGAVAVPSDILVVPAFPETRSGKYMRRFLTAMMNDEPLGDTSTLRNPECLTDLDARIQAWKRGQQRAEEQTLIERQRFLSVQYDRLADGVRMATVAIDNPPVNALSDRLLDELDTAISHLARRPDIRAVVITGTGRNFVAGADIRQLLDEVQDEGEARALPAKAHAVFRAIEAMDKPVIAAIRGVALGGGCELAMACHLRVADPRARLGQPEINLFLPPGYGGTQRLPRLLLRKDAERGYERALEILLSGRQIDAETALEFGLVDVVARGADDALTLAKSLAREAALAPTLTLPRFAGEGTAAGALQGSCLPPLRSGGGSGWGQDSPEIARLLKQAHAVGRGQVADTIVDLVTTGLRDGFDAGSQAEIAAFARFLLDPTHGAKKGIALFLEKKSPPLPARPRRESRDGVLPIGSPFFPGATPLPQWQLAQAVVRDLETGAASHGDPADAEQEVVVPVPEPSPNQALVYVLASEVNYNDVWALTGIPISLFDEHDEDVHITGSGGVGMVVRMGEALQAQGRLAVGDLVAIYSGVSDVLDPEAGADPMFTDFHIQGYQSPDGSHQQFMLADGPQLFHLPPDLALEEAGSYMLAAGTAYRALFTALDVRPGKRLLVEGAAGGTGAWTVELALARRMKVTGMVSSERRAAAIRARGAGAVDRSVAESAFTRIPADPSQWAAWEEAGRPYLDALRAANGGALVDYAVSHAGEATFPRTFQSLAEGGALTFFGASSGYHMTFLGKPGSAEPAEMLRRARLRPGEAVLVFYGAGAVGLRDDMALSAIEAARESGARICVVTDQDSERDFVLSLGYGEALAGAVSLAEIRRRVPHFVWPDTMPDLPDPQRETAAFKEAVRLFTEETFKPLGQAVGRILRSADNPRGMPDVVVERARRDTLAVSTMLVKPHTGRVVYCGDMNGKRYSFYAPQVWMRQRRILMPTAAIVGTHLSNAAEIAGLNRIIASGAVRVPTTYLGAWDELPTLHQAMWENCLPEATGGAAKAVVNHALPEAGLKTKDELLIAWAGQAQGQGAVGKEQ
ncbi:AMP-binding protein [Azospirillum rugosum]|uniref:acetate--CoA ligase n=1 Tax=Azospirillum rugosum TaxID=416170 RepID=A0ABS4SQI2_9PROT|nr:AMP-binding protein [Azospirillum rugosum]MBP2294816.1 acrylyl-CoA reductase (NADPH)/3-hydroxypropionyl-CoA dehydratase/3-hydroxypropionyl-CoA synthetase [Azospirillum rugosum]MDQ0528262.1 acrylyl-CoA reductase (NADPH)/3-hydroxypropionyl-CoA dehydratase/3-hydroxypropionyl-CoA synthetase [Azospirillum rugosum]